jgi:hypothetical protein
MSEIEDGARRPELEAARLGSDLDRGMDDEAVPAEASADTARHWIHVYTQLTSLEAHLIAEARTMLPTLSRSARNEAELTNLPLLESQLRRFQHRQHLWEERLHQLERAGKA